jgi:hypothetical protein
VSSATSSSRVCSAAFGLADLLAKKGRGSSAIFNWVMGVAIDVDLKHDDVIEQENSRVSSLLHTEER